MSVDVSCFIEFVCAGMYLGGSGVGGDGGGGLLLLAPLTIFCAIASQELI